MSGTQGRCWAKLCFDVPNARGAMTVVTRQTMLVKLAIAAARAVSELGIALMVVVAP